MEEVLTRRFRRWQVYHESDEVGKKAEPSFSILPDLLIVDGGKGQLSRALKVLEEFELSEKIKAVGLAKSEELVILPDQDKPLALPRNSQGLFMMQRIRDAKEKQQKGEVVAAGPGKLLDSGSRAELSVKVGDTVLFGKYAGNDVKLNGEELKIMRESDILAKVE